jgi:hypothetical protein
MKHEAENPLFHAATRFLTETGRYPATHVDIFWNRTNGSGSKIRDVEVVLVPRILLRDRDLQVRYKDWNQRWESDLGNSVNDWMRSGGLSPAKVFAHLMVIGFEDDEKFWLAIEEFAHIEECFWAREMAEFYREKQ